MTSITLLLVISQVVILVSQTHGICNENISVQNGRVEYKANYYVVSCDPGFALDGEKVVYCVRNKWEDSSPSCSYKTDDNPCKNLGGCQQICKNDQGRAKCRCRDGYTLADDGKSCIETEPETYGHPEPSHVSGPQRNVVIVHRGGHSHSLAEGNKPSDEADPCHNHRCAQLCRIEDGLAHCRCHRGYLLNEDKTTCHKNLGPPIHPAVHQRKLCEHNNGGCDHNCHQQRFGLILCSCNPGYYLHHNKKSCILLQPVSRPTSCYYSNGGCQYTCSTRGNSVVCSCPEGYKLHTDQKNCVALPRVTCDVDNGGCEYYCSMGRNNVVCSCPPGYQLDVDRKRCIDIDECKHERLNNCHHICENTEGSFACRCHPGYVKINNKCEGCRKNAYWSTEKNGCVDCPPNSYTLSDGKMSLSDCLCRPGYTGSPRENIPCLDNDECATDNFGCSHTCVNAPSGAFCSCPEGFQVDKDNKTCIDINECSIKNGGCEGLCINTNGSFHCKCASGFVPSNKDHYSCDDVDECSVNNGGCQQLCDNYRGGYYCSCRKGYRLDGTLKNCTEILCPALPVPHFSTIRCKSNSEVLPEMDNYPIGAICTFKCISGFKDASHSNKMKCLEDGTWEGSLSQCKSQRCPPLKVPENGDVHPPSCETGGNTVKQKCTFTCRQGYKLVGPPVFGCKNNLTWDKPVNNTPVCQPEGIRASMECIRDINATLLPGQSSQNVTIPEPVTNMESYEIFPKDVVVGKPYEFKAGKTRVVFTASSLSSNRTAKCMTTVHVIDEEPPVFLSCPEYMLIKDAKVDGEIVTWDEPEVTDNVKVESLTSSVAPNTTLIPGSYVVEYVATDAEGNSESCSFKIDVVRLSCEDLKDPGHGEANCMDWIYGRICQPLCDDGYMRDPSEAQFYSCGDSGVWEPSYKISDCMPFTEADSSQCPDGKELKVIEETDEEICLECPPNSWSSTTRRCEV